MDQVNYFEEGGEAYREWANNNRYVPMPENPYEVGTQAHIDWQVGFDDAMTYEIHGQYESGED